MVESGYCRMIGGEKLVRRPNMDKKIVELQRKQTVFLEREGSFIPIASLHISN